MTRTNDSTNKNGNGSWIRSTGLLLALTVGSQWCTESIAFMPILETCRSAKFKIITRTYVDCSHHSAPIEEESSKKEEYLLQNRRDAIKTVTSAVITSSVIPAAAASASTGKSRTADYTVQRSEREWAYLLSGAQYNILRQGGTERPYSSILEGEEREGVYKCAACASPLFYSSQKFHSGTGWPSYASMIGNNVEVENVNAIQANLAGAEVRCHTCGGHLGDVFNDGFLYVNTPAFQTGKRFCVDGAALMFTPSAAGSEDVFGDTPPPSKVQTLPNFLAPPKINARS